MNLYILKVGGEQLYALESTSIFINEDLYTKTIYAVGITNYAKNGKRHRDRGPAFIRGNHIEWCQNGKLHRDDGPAVTFESGKLQWHQHGELHRDDGPAVIYPDGFMVWFQHGMSIKSSSGK